ncbi:MAG: flagellar basal body-associated protein FliL [Firmicutes bacterium]|nr:flagellar basal body-associated protein FliL [Bacillota bacterium]
MAETTKGLSIKLIIGAVIATLLVCSGIAYYVFTNYFMDNKKTVQREPGIFLKLGDKDGLVLNIGSVNSGRYLKIGLILELSPDKNAAPKEGKSLSPEEVKIQDIVLHVLRSQKPEEFEPNKQEQLKTLLKNEINAALGKDRVYQVYITTFLLQ